SWTSLLPLSPVLASSIPAARLFCGSLQSLYYGFNRPWHQHQQRYVMTMQLCELHELECHCSGFRTTKWTLFFVGNLGVCRCKIHVSEKCRYKMYL
uniref:Uncharacterized protein n=1 Tax=Oryza glaberrima TaxID=4538 RepID=I1P766_ORYGL